MKFWKESSPPSLIPLRYVLDAQQLQNRMTLPHDLYPDSVEPSSVLWSDGVQTHSYMIRGEVMAKHIFPCNILQQESEALFHEIQANVELRRRRAGINIHGARVTSG